MKKTKTINVTAADICKAKKFIKRGNCCSGNCPIALAMKRAFRTDSVEVSMSDALVKGGIILLPPEAGTFVDRFDLGCKVQPFKFKVEL